MKALQIQEPVEERNITANIFSMITFWSVKKTDYEKQDNRRYMVLLCKLELGAMSLQLCNKTG
jgi:hypothetical protein